MGCVGFFQGSVSSPGPPQNPDGSHGVDSLRRDDGQDGPEVLTQRGPGKDGPAALLGFCQGPLHLTTLESDEVLAGAWQTHRLQLLSSRRGIGAQLKQWTRLKPSEPPRRGSP